MVAEEPAFLSAPAGACWSDRRHMLPKGRVEDRYMALETQLYMAYLPDYIDCQEEAMHELSHTVWRPPAGGLAGIHFSCSSGSALGLRTAFWRRWRPQPSQYPLTAV